MAGKDPKSDTTLLRIARNVGFNARVEPMWHTFDRLRERVGWLEKWRLKRHFNRIVARVNEQLQKSGVATGDWDKTGGTCVCNLRVAKFGLISGLRDHVAAKLDKDRAAKWNHLAGLHEMEAISIPLDFPEPFTVATTRSPKPLSVTSSLRLDAELKEIDAAMKVSGGFSLAKIAKIDYLDAKDKEIAVYESRFSSMDDFWPRFAYSLLRKLAEKSVETRLPIWFA